jgi:hypothetical protein
MADNVTILDADEAEVVIGSDDCSGVQVQLVKLAQSADGSATPIAADPDHDGHAHRLRRAAL